MVPAPLQHANQSCPAKALIFYSDTSAPPRNTNAGNIRMVIVATGLGIHGSYQYKTSWVFNGILCPADGYNTIFKWLTQDFEYGSLKLGQIIRKRTPLCAKEISPGCGFSPPPTNAMLVVLFNNVVYSRSAES